MDSNTHFQHQENQSNSGLLRFRSAPSHVLSNLKRGVGGVAGNLNEDLEPERVVLRFMNSSEKDSPSWLREFVDIHNKPSASKSASPLSRMGGNGSSSSSFSHSQCQRHSSVGMDQRQKSFNSNLLRQSSFPAGAGNFSNNISFQNGYDSMKGVGNYGGVNGSDGELSLSMNRLKNQINFSSREGFGATQLNGELGNQIHHTLSPHLSLLRESSEIFAMENMLHLPDSVPCKIRAKRGFATHPRSIAERVRRTRISERIRKLQELVPNMDKQTSTAEMLDLAVDYIIDLQKQYKTLSEKRARCKCISMKKLETNQVS